MSLHKAVCEDPSLPDELLYGRAGYLYALLFVQGHIGSDTIDSEIIHKVKLNCAGNKSELMCYSCLWIRCYIIGDSLAPDQTVEVDLELYVSTTFTCYCLQ